MIAPLSILLSQIIFIPKPLVVLLLTGSRGDLEDEGQQTPLTQLSVSSVVKALPASLTADQAIWRLGPALFISIQSRLVS